jgi:hypothetical protein
MQALTSILLNTFLFFGSPEKHQSLLLAPTDSPVSLMRKALENARVEDFVKMEPMSEEEVVSSIRGLEKKIPIFWATVTLDYLWHASWNV